MTIWVARIVDWGCCTERDHENVLLSKALLMERFEGLKAAETRERPITSPVSQVEVRSALEETDTSI